MKRLATPVLIAVALTLSACGSAVTDAQQETTTAPSTTAPAISASTTATQPIAAATASAAPSPELDQLVDEYFAAWTDYDSNAFLSLVTEGYTWQWDDQSWTARQKTGEIERYESVNFRVEFTSERLWSGIGPGYALAQSHVIYTDSGFPGPDGIDSTSVLDIVEQDGEYLVACHSFHG